MAEQTTGESCRYARHEASQIIGHNNAVRVRLDSEDQEAMDRIADILTPHQGQDRLVTGEPLQPKGRPSFEKEKMFIEKAGLSDKDELERFGLEAIVKALYFENEQRRAFYFNPFDSRFSLEPVELTE